MATTYKLKRKAFGLMAPFAKTGAAFKNANAAFKAGNTKQGMKSLGAGIGRGAIGVGKLGLAGAAVGGAAFAKDGYDKLTGSFMDEE